MSFFGGQPIYSNFFSSVLALKTIGTQLLFWSVVLKMHKKTLFTAKIWIWTSKIIPDLWLVDLFCLIKKMSILHPSLQLPTRPQPLPGRRRRYSQLSEQLRHSWTSPPELCATSSATPVKHVQLQAPGLLVRCSSGLVWCGQGPVQAQESDVTGGALLPRHSGPC